MMQRSPGTKYPLIRRIKLGFQGWFWKNLDIFRCSNLVRKLYTISLIIYGISVVIPFLLALLGLPESYEALVIAPFAIALAFAAAGVGIVLYHAVRRLWGTTFGRIILGLFLALSSFGADLYGRQEIYKMTGENPEAFTSARIALAGLFTPFVWFGMAGFFAYVGILVPLKWFAQVGMWLLSSPFEYRRSFPAFHFSDLGHAFGSVGLFCFIGLGFVLLEAQIPHVGVLAGRSRLRGRTIAKWKDQLSHQ